MEDRVRRIRSEIVELARAGHDWVTFSTHVTESLRRLIRFDRSCWHSVDPGTVLLTGSLNQGIGCSGSWLAHHEFVVDDVNKWWFLARSGRQAGATSIATHGDLSRSARHVSHESFGIGDELRAALVTDGTYWGAVGILRDRGEPWFTETDVRTVASLSSVIAEGFRRALIVG
ncbi:MAG TPA: LuxR family transcriptional regulator, partial [Actinomycetota bacterium]|nr:LuxR family transcriptional regulator [Actinomycetota bacterium]